MLLIPLVEAPTYQHLPSSSYDKTNYVLRRKKERNAIEYGVCRDEESEKERNVKATHDRFRPFSNASIVPIHQSHLSQRRRSCCVGASGDCCMREEYLSSIHVLKTWTYRFVTVFMSIMCDSTESKLIDFFLCQINYTK